MEKSKFKISTLVVILVALAGTFFYSCQNEEIQETIPVDLPYLSFSGNAETEISNLSESDLKVLGLAFERLKLVEEDGLFRMVTKSATQINISEELFDYFEGIVERSNERILNSNLSLVPRIKTKSEGGGSPNNCVAKAVVEIAGQMGHSMSLSQVERWIEERYGSNGVPSGKMQDVMSHYFETESVSISNGYSVPAGQQVLVVFRGGENEGHAVRFLYCSGDIVLGSDGRTYPLNQVAQAYLIKGVR